MLSQIQYIFTKNTYVSITYVNIYTITPSRYKPYVIEINALLDFIIHNKLQL